MNYSRMLWTSRPRQASWSSCSRLGLKLPHWQEAGPRVAPSVEMHQHSPLLTPQTRVRILGSMSGKHKTRIFMELVMGKQEDQGRWRNPHQGQWLHNTSLPKALFPPAILLKSKSVSNYLRIHQSQNFPFLEVLPGFLSEIPFLLKEQGWWDNTQLGRAIAPDS